MGIIRMYVDRIQEHVAWKEGRQRTEPWLLWHLWYSQEEEEPTKETEGAARGEENQERACYWSHSSYLPRTDP